MSMWGGRFTGDLDDAVKRLNDSFGFDCRLWREDIEGSIAYAKALERAGVLSRQEAAQIVAALDELTETLGDADLPFTVHRSPFTGSPESSENADLPFTVHRSPFTDNAPEDIHSCIESLLKDRIGPLAGKLHTGRSRNDQVATDTRLYVRNAIDAISTAIKRLQSTLTNLAEQEIETVMPGYTHLQHAQPILLSHHLLAYFWMLQRDRERLIEVRKRVNVLPLGSGALAGSTVNLDRHFLAEQLQFEDISQNSLDAVSDRDYILEFLSASSILSMHLSRFAEEIILWNTREFGFIELDDSVTTGSSMMPQKKNPDVAELARAKPGRIYGHLIALLTVLKGQPLAYNKDLQEDKEGLFDTVDTLLILLPAFDSMLSTARFNRKRMAEAALGDFSTATDLADFLVKAGVPFREAHETIGKIVAGCVQKGKALEDLSSAELAAHHPALAAAPTGWDAVHACLKARELPGGTGPSAVKAQLEQARRTLVQPQRG